MTDCPQALQLLPVSVILPMLHVHFRVKTTVTRRTNGHSLGACGKQRSFANLQYFHFSLSFKVLNCSLTVTVTPSENYSRHLHQYSWQSVVFSYYYRLNKLGNIHDSDTFETYNYLQSVIKAKLSLFSTRRNAGKGRHSSTIS